MEKRELTLFAVIAVTLVFLSSTIFFSSNSNFVTGNAVAGGGVDIAGDKESANPTKGVLKGTVTYTIKDGEATINSEYAENATLYLVKAGNTFANFSKVLLSSKNYKFNMVTVDVDGATSRCSSNSYTTTLNYYDENDNSQEDGQEFEVYKTVTDDNGCYAAKLKSGAYDLYL